MKTVLLLAAIFACACASPASSRLALWPKANKGRITGGANAARNQFPYQVSLQYRNDDGLFQHVCGGSILSPTYVVTAGHCITESPGLENIQVVAGILNLNEAGVVVNVAETLVHPDYEGGVGPNDLALVRLASALPLSESIQPVLLPVAGSDALGNAVFSGWGDTSTVGWIHDYPLILQYANVTVLTYDDCAAALMDVIGNTDALTPSILCTGPLYDFISACYGDSGSPVVQPKTNKLIGVSCWGYSPCGTPGAPSGHVKVSHFVDFIKANVPDLPDSIETDLE